MIGKLLTQVIIKGKNFESSPLKNLFEFDDFEDEYALINLYGKGINYLEDMAEAIDKIYAQKEVWTSENIEKLLIFLIFPYEKQGNSEIPTEILRKMVELNAHLCLTFYEMQFLSH